MRVSIFKIINIVDWIFKTSFRPVNGPDTGWTWYSKRPLPSFWWKQMGGGHLHADFITAFVYNLGGESALGLLRTSLIYNHALCMSNSLSPFLNSLASAAHFQPDVTEGGKSWLVFGGVFTSCCELWNVTVSEGSWIQGGGVPEPEAGRVPLAGAQQGWEQGSLRAWCGSSGWSSPRETRCQSLLTEQLVFSKPASWCRGCPEEVSTHGAAPQWVLKSSC